MSKIVVDATVPPASATFDTDIPVRSDLIMISLLQDIRDRLDGLLYYFHGHDLEEDECETDTVQ